MNANNFSQAGNISQSRLEIIQTWVHRNQKSDAISNFPSLSAANSADANIAQTQTHWSIKSSGQLLNSQNVIFFDYCWKYVSGPWTNIAKCKPWTETSWNWRKVVGNNLPASRAFLLRKITKFQTRGTFRLLIQQIMPWYIMSLHLLKNFGKKKNKMLLVQIAWWFERCLPVTDTSGSSFTNFVPFAFDWINSCFTSRP